MKAQSIVAAMALGFGTVLSFPAHAMAWSTDIWIPSIVATSSSQLGLDGIHHVIHQQQLVLFSPWKTGVTCGGAPVSVALSWYNNSGVVVASGSSSVVPCARTVIPAVDQVYGAPDGAHLRLTAPSPIVATWTLAPKYEWTMPTFVEQPGLDGVNPYSRWVFSDVNYSTASTSNGAVPPYSNSYSFASIKIVNPKTTAVTVDVVLVSDSGVYTDTAYTIPARGEKSVRLDAVLATFTGQLIVQAQGTGKVLTWGTWFQYPVSNASLPPIVRALEPIAFNP